MCNLSRKYGTVSVLSPAKAASVGEGPLSKAIRSVHEAEVQCNRLLLKDRHNQIRDRCLIAEYPQWHLQAQLGDESFHDTNLAQMSGAIQFSLMVLSCYFKRAFYLVGFEALMLYCTQMRRIREQG